MVVFGIGARRGRLRRDGRRRVRHDRGQAARSRAVVASAMSVRELTSALRILCHSGPAGATYMGTSRLKSSHDGSTANAGHLGTIRCWRRRMPQLRRTPCLLLRPSGARAGWWCDLIACCQTARFGWNDQRCWRRCKQTGVWGRVPSTLSFVGSRTPHPIISGADRAMSDA
jgi:hypothetical protein